MKKSSMAIIKQNELGVQPLDQLMIKIGLTNHDLVSASIQQLTHKMVAKARRGRRLTVNVQGKILAALNILRPEDQFNLKEIFNY